MLRLVGWHDIDLVHFVVERASMNKPNIDCAEPTALKQVINKRPEKYRVNIVIRYSGRIEMLNKHRY